MEIYDVYISLGRDCKPAHYLQRFGLRRQSFPLDWQIVNSLDTIIHLFETEFSDFFEAIEVNELECGADGNRKVVDVKNNIISIHHFPKDIEVEAARQLFVQKMRKRYKRLDKELRNARNTALIMDRLDSRNALVMFLQQFSKIYPHLEITLINMRNDESLRNEVYQEVLFSHEKKTLIEYTFNDFINYESNKKFNWMGDERKWEKILWDYVDASTLKNLEELQKKGPLIIYGAGQNCVYLLRMFEKYGALVNGIAVSEVEKNPDNINGIKVNSLDAYSKDSVIIVSVKNDNIQNEILNKCLKKGYKKTITYRKLFWG